MKNYNLFILIIMVISTLTIFSSCSKDERSNFKDFKIENRAQTLTHEEVVKIISIMVADPLFNQELTNSINNSNTRTSNSVSFMELLSGTSTSIFCQSFNQACSQLRISDGLTKFINGTLASNPNLCLSIHLPDDTQIQNQIFSSLPAFSEQLYDEIYNNQNYVFYKLGELDPSLTTSNEPDFPVCVIQEREGFTSLLKTQLSNESYFNTHSKVIYSPGLINRIDFQSLNYNPLVNDRTLNICGTNYLNPFIDRYFLKDNDLTTLFNEEEDYTFYFPPPTPPNGNYLCSNGMPSQRTTFNNTVNKEFSHSIKLPLGNDVLELNNDWCAWWNRNCRFMVDLYLPSKFNSTTYEPLTLTKFYWYNEKKLKEKDFVTPVVPAEFVPWYYEEGSHGNEWKFNWTGKHRKEGVMNEFTLGAQLSAEMKFKEPFLGSELKLTPALNATYKTSRTNKDLFLGGDFVYWCDDILVNANRGYRYSTGDVEFHIREKE